MLAQYAGLAGVVVLELPQPATSTVPITVATNASSRAMVTTRTLSHGWDSLGGAMSAPIDSSTWDRRYADSRLLWSTEPNRFLVSEVSELEPGHALDVACGEGRNAVWLATLRWRVIGVDFSSVGLEKARVLARSRGVEVEWIAADLKDYKPEPEAFSLVIAFYLQVAATDRRKILRSVADAIGPGGTFLLVAHDRTNIERGYGGPQDPSVLYAPQDDVEDLAPAGLTIERAETVKRPVQTADGERVALDALVRARRV
jgi:SAM-dependent methyltransferase